MKVLEAAQRAGAAAAEVRLDRC